MANLHLVYLDINTGYFPGLHHGLAWLVASVRRKGHTVTFHHLSNEESPHAVVDRALQNNPNVVGFSLTTNQRQYLAKYSRALRGRTDVIQIAGGVHPTLDPSDVLSLPSIQGVCIGEGERTLPELLGRLDRADSLSTTPGFWWRNARGTVRRNPAPPIDPDLSALPYPDYSAFDVNQINTASSGWMAMMLTRGCPHHCSYCCNDALRSVYPNRNDYVRLPPIDYAIALVQHNLSQYPGVKGINFADDLLTLRADWFDAFADAYRREVNVPFTCNARPEYLSQRTCAALKRAGCVLVQIGVESGNEWVRRTLLNRRPKNDAIVKAFRRVQNVGIDTFAYNMLGLPFETKEQMEQTLSFNKRLAPDMGSVFYFFPFPGTRLYSVCSQFGLLEAPREALSSYLQAPAIKLTHCKRTDCQRVYNSLRLYLVARAATKGLAYGAVLTSTLLYLLFHIWPSFFVSLFTRRSKLKSMIRKIMYGKLYSEGED